MNNLQKFSTEEIIGLIKEGKVTAADLTDSGICPTCFNKENNSILYGDNTDKIIYEDDLFECFLAGNPRAYGHTIISTKIHYKDMSECDDETLKQMIILSKRMQNIIKKVYSAESVYLCTMCDGKMNHFHYQLIPRYQNEKRGSTNFVKPRFEYIEDKAKIKQLRYLSKENL